MIRFCVSLVILSWLAISCRYAKDYATPTPDLPAPFSYKPAAVQLAEVYWYDELREKYIYKNGRLAEQHNILVAGTGSEETYGINYYDRREGVLNSLSYWRWPGIGGYENGPIGKLELFNTLTFDPLQGDSLRTATLSEPNRVALVKYGINPKGYITDEQGRVQGGSILLKRNGQNNVSQSRSGTTTITYEYDDHPNPFFAMGRVDDLAIDTSPNNVIRRFTKYVSGNDTYTSTTTYKYTYRPNGYPNKVVIDNSNSPTVETLLYKYND